jgi:hypothetical protein
MFGPSSYKAWNELLYPNAAPQQALPTVAPATAAEPFSVNLGQNAYAGYGAKYTSALPTMATEMPGVGESIYAGYGPQALPTDLASYGGGAGMAASEAIPGAMSMDLGGTGASFLSSAPAANMTYDAALAGGEALGAEALGASAGQAAATGAGMSGMTLAQAMPYIGLAALATQYGLKQGWFRHDRGIHNVMDRNIRKSAKILRDIF